MDKIVLDLGKNKDHWELHFLHYLGPRIIKILLLKHIPLKVFKKYHNPKI